MRTMPTTACGRALARCLLAAALSVPALGAHAAGALDRAGDRAGERTGARSADRGGGGHADRCRLCRTRRCACRLDRGWVTIGRSRVDFRFGESLARPLAEALRCDGFDAWVRDGCVIVKGRHHRVRVIARGYRFKVWCDGYTTVIQPHRFHRGGHWRGHDRRRFRRDVHRRGFHRWHDRKWHDRRFRHWRHRRGC
ncbi:MAG: hypothetical protein AAGF47_00240 [Planctomycetota bacterium]